MNIELDPEGLCHLLIRTRPDLCPADRRGKRRVTPEARAWLAGEMGVSDDAVYCWMTRRYAFPPDRQTQASLVCSLHARKVRAHGAPHALLEGRRILVVEDNLISALNYVGYLSECGAVVPDPCADLDEARLAAEQAWDAALVDLMLDRDLSWPVVIRLRERGVPVVLLTGWPTQPASTPPALSPAPPRIIKPIIAAEEWDAVLGLLAAMIVPAEVAA